MESPTNAIKKLWTTGFFKEHRKTKDVEDRALRAFGCTSANWTATLKSIKFLRKIGKKGWIQKGSADPDGNVLIFYVEAGKPRTATKKFEAAIADVSDEVLKISDPYLTEDSLYLLEKIKAKHVNFLFIKDKNKLPERTIRDFKQENPHVDLRGYEAPHLHDRYILGKNKMWIVGHGLSLKNKETFIIELDDNVARDLRLSLVETFNRRWKMAKSV